jgi:hypothetical protein
MALAFCIYLLSRTSRAQLRTIAESIDVGLVDNVQEVDSPGKLHHIFRALFSGLNGDQLYALRFDANKAIGLQAAWEFVRRTANEEVRRIESHRIKLDAPGVWAFLGFAEGKLNCQLPNWWKQGIAEGVLEQVDDTLIPYADKSDDEVHIPYVLIDEKYWLPRGMILVEQIRPRIQIIAKDDRFEIPEKLLKRVLEQSNWEGNVYCNVLRVAEGRFLLTVHGPYPEPYKLFCLVAGAKPTGSEPPAVEWESEVWVGHSAGISYSGGVPRHYSTLLLDGEEVLVVGLSPESAYIEGFRLKDGKSSFRFSTSY